jgi:HEAT repeat protein
MRRKLSFWLSFALLPSVLVLGRAAWADADKGDAEDGDGDDEMAAAHKPADLSKKRAKVLAALTTDEGVLINVTRKEMPASPDILNLGKRATKALARCAADNVDDRIRTTCASLLGRLGDRSALPALQGALEAWSPTVRHAAILALGKIPDASSRAPLEKLLARYDETTDNLAAVYRTLGMLSDPKALGTLREALRAPKEKVLAGRLPPFEGLWRSRHLMARGTLVSDVEFALKSDDLDLQLAGIRAAGELRASELVPALVPLMEKSDARVRNRSVYALGRIGDKAATKALLAELPKVREARMLNNIGFALERLDPPSFYSTMEGLVAHKQASIRMNAAFVLGDVRRPEGLSMLKKGLGDANDYVRVSAAVALGKIDDKGGLPLLEPLVDDKNATLREEAIHSVFTLSGFARKDLLWDKLYPSTKPAVKLRAAIALGKALDPRVADDLLRCVERNTCKLREVEAYLRAAPDAAMPGRILLAWVKGSSELGGLVALQKPTGAAALATSELSSAYGGHDLRRAAFAADLLGDVGDAKAPPVLLPLLGDEHSRLRLHGAIALARFSVPQATDADKALLSDLDKLPADWLGTVVRLLGHVQEPTVRARLLPELQKREKGTDVPVAMAAAAVRLEWDPEAAVFRLLDALASKDALERDLAERYLTRGRHALLTTLLRRALSRETRDPVKMSLRKVLDLRAGMGDST